MRLPLAGGSPQRVGEILQVIDLWCGSRAGSRCVLADFQDDQFILFELDPLTDSRAELLRIDFTPSTWPSLRLSPDATRVAMTSFSASREDSNHVRIFGLENKRVREIVVKEMENVPPLSWSADGEGFYGYRRDTRTLVHIDLQGRVREVRKLDMGRGATRLRDHQPGHPRLGRLPPLRPGAGPAERPPGGPGRPADPPRLARRRARPTRGRRWRAS